MSKVKQPVVCLLTDFGLKDSYVGMMKGVLLSQVPNVKIIDISHEIPPQNIQLGAYQLLSSFDYFPMGALIICVVDPGVGTKRKILYVETKNKKFIGPDNGVLSWALEKEPAKKIIAVDPNKVSFSTKSQTFHGRDIMAPLAGQILKGKSPNQLGKVISKYKKISFPSVTKVGAKWKGEVLAVDGFGNLITNFKSDELRVFEGASKVWIDFGDRRHVIRGLSKSYEEVSPGQLLALHGSAGFLEISLRDGNAFEKTQWGLGKPIILNFRT